MCHPVADGCASGEEQAKRKEEVDAILELRRA
jgi:hypothetical protein